MTIPSTTSPPYFFQFRLATLLILTTWAAIVCAGLATPSPPWPTIIGAASLLSFLIAAVLIIYRAGQIRAVAVGYLIFGGGYMLYEHFQSPTNLLLAIPGNDEDLGSFAALLYYKLHRDNSISSTSSPTWSATFPPARFNFFKIYHHALATFLGLLGSLLAQYLHATQRHNPSTTNNP
jgi:hypothetical protein